MIEARCRSREGAVVERENVRRISCWDSVTVTLAALPGMVRELPAIGKIVHPGNFEGFVNSLGSQIRKVGLAGSGASSPLTRSMPDAAISRQSMNSRCERSSTSTSTSGGVPYPSYAHQEIAP